MYLANESVARQYSILQDNWNTRYSSFKFFKYKRKWVIYQYIPPNNQIISKEINEKI